MARRGLPRLSVGEMEILSMLWDHGPVSLSEAHAALGQKIGYTTTQTRLNRLAEKGLVTRSSDRPAKYEAAVGENDVSAGHLDVLLEKLGDVQVVPLIAHLVSRQQLTTDQIGELERLIADARPAASVSKGRASKVKKRDKR